MGLYCRWVEGRRWVEESEGASRTSVVGDEYGSGNHYYFC